VIRSAGRIFGPRREEVAENWRRLHNEELITSPNIIRVIKSRRKRLTVNVARMGEMIYMYKTLVEKSKRKGTTLNGC
jgi:hypothetical protein